MATCTRQGCGKKFDPTQNLQAECVFHPGQPVFHEGLKSWSCCKEKNKPVMEFDQFMKIEGCATGVHSLEKPVTPAREPEAEKPASSVDANGTMTYSADVQKKETSATKHSHQTTRDVFQPITAEQAIESQPALPKPELLDDPESIVLEGSRCKRLACGITWNGLGNSKRGELDKEECTYHPGTPVFHEGSKGYSCCKRRVLDFDDFLKLRGCKKSSHLFTETSSTKTDQEESVDCRFDFYQTPTSVIVSIFAKKVDQEKSLIKFDTSGVNIDLKLPANKRFQRTFNLFGSIDPDQSTYKILSTKCEMVLIKTDGRSWSNLEKGDTFVGTVTFGVGGRTGTVGAKQIVT
ncbi:hypothetical protein PTTG_04028 [Puccinia triticina 1-1 BBBD Race 1]|uniref:Chord-domain-containing protein n=2 Tax=Puccinia triticina TaxID=208348 RepID=A0A180GUC1_PUCT1|nr:uncharacterized protein PtA15_7A178 [Puccinia triticina]OAV96396.1 hypothetical protein PTTG_04028 [Puccinia triticina 1-1 BBBD Race 1]WAQ86452.1 hypothetical protein PtA15_7A178 [Puccinia triticina]WAR56332.1 hypothetical protein PtB15_7B178 [Puccinia triticina]